jgi:hypothetical protein
VYDLARERWSVLRAMDRGGASVDGNVMPGQAMRLGKSSDKRGLWGAADDAGETTMRTGTGRLGEDALGDYYDALRFKSSQIGKPIVGNSGTATRSAVGQWLQGGSTAGMLVGGAKNLALTPPMRAYANMSPEAAQRAVEILEAMRAAEVAGGGAVGGLAGRGGVLGGVLGNDQP